MTCQGIFMISLLKYLTLIDVQFLYHYLYLNYATMDSFIKRAGI